MPPNTERRKHFNKGLALLEKTQVSFAAEHGVSVQHLQEVLLGRRASQRLNALIDAVIAVVPPEHIRTASPPESAPAAAAA